MQRLLYIQYFTTLLGNSNVVSLRLSSIENVKRMKDKARTNFCRTRVPFLTTTKFNLSAGNALNRIFDRNKFLLSKKFVHRNSILVIIIFFLHNSPVSAQLTYKNLAIQYDSPWVYKNLK